jgi:hypothetical protein
MTMAACFMMVAVERWRRSPWRRKTKTTRPRASSRRRVALSRRRAPCRNPSRRSISPCAVASHHLLPYFVRPAVFTSRGPFRSAAAVRVRPRGLGFRAVDSPKKIRGKLFVAQPASRLDKADTTCPVRAEPAPPRAVLFGFPCPCPCPRRRRRREPPARDGGRPRRRQSES